MATTGLLLDPWAGWGSKISSSHKGPPQQPVSILSQVHRWASNPTADSQVSVPSVHKPAKPPRPKAWQKGLSAQPWPFSRDLEVTKVHAHSRKWAGLAPWTPPRKEKTQRQSLSPAEGTSDWKDFPKQIMNSLQTGCNLQRLYDARQGNASIW